MFVPNEAVAEIESQAAYLARHGTPMLIDYAEREAASGERTVAINERWIAVVPYWAYWPYETIVIPRRPVATLTELDTADDEALAEVLGVLERDELLGHDVGVLLSDRGCGALDRLIEQVGELDRVAGPAAHHLSVLAQHIAEPDVHRFGRLRQPASQSSRCLPN